MRHLRLWKLRASELWQSLLLEVRHAKVWHELLPDPCCHPRRLWSEACLWWKTTRHRTACGSTPREDQQGGQREQSAGARDDTRTRRRRGLKSDHWRRKRARRLQEGRYTLAEGASFVAPPRGTGTTAFLFSYSELNQFASRTPPVCFPFLFSLQHPLFSSLFSRENSGETIKFSGL